MRIGLSTPAVIRMPGTAKWECDADIEDLAVIACVADDLGYAYLTCSEHVAVPDSHAAYIGSTYWDPVATLSFLAARTTRIRLATAVIVLGYHHPVKIAKQYGTLDKISAGRLILGVGVGSLAAEFELLGAEFGDRGRRADDAMRALRASLSQPRPVYHGDYFRYDSIVVDPCAVQPRVPIWVGGQTRRSLRRAVEFGDGWMPIGIAPVDIPDHLASVEPIDGFDIVLSATSLDPVAAPRDVETTFEQLAEVGATAVTVSLTAGSRSEFCDQLRALRAVTADLADWPATTA